MLKAIVQDLKKRIKGPHKALLIGLSSRILVVAVFVLCSVFFTVSSQQPAAHLNNPLPLVHLFDRYDSGYYISIAINGYPKGYPDINYWIGRNFSFSELNPVLAMPDWAFFPLYPAAMKVVSLPFLLFFVNTEINIQNAVEFAGFVISNVAFFVSVYFFFKLTNKIFISTRIALVASAFYSFWGGAVFYSAVYSEALFMALALGAFYYLEEDKLPTAVLLGFLASFTRSNGFLICIPFLIYAIQSIKNKSKTIKLLTCSALVASSFLIFQFIGYMVAGGVFPITVIAHDLNFVIYPLLSTQLISLFNSSLKTLTFYVIGLALIFLPAAYFIRYFNFRSFKNNLIQDSKKLKYWAFYASMIFVIVFQSNVFSVVRYAVPMLPIYWVSAIIYIKNRSIGIAIFAIMTGLLVIGSYMFETGGTFF
jgi:hypothetical protein